METSTKKQHNAVNKVAICSCSKWRNNSTDQNQHTDYTHKMIAQQPAYNDGTQLPFVNTGKYLGMTLDAKVRWKEHIKKKRDDQNIKLRKMDCLLAIFPRYHHTTNQFYLSKFYVRRPVIVIFKWFKNFKNKVIKFIVNVRWYVYNVTSTAILRSSWLKIKKRYKKLIKPKTHSFTFSINMNLENNLFIAVGTYN